MDVEIRLAALEQLVRVLVMENWLSGNDAKIIRDRAHGALMGSDGPGGPEQKVMACKYIDQLLYGE